MFGFLFGWFAPSDDSSDLPEADIKDRINYNPGRPAICSGRFCDLYKGHHKQYGQVAMKRLRINNLDISKEDILKFQQEADTWRPLDHDYILKFLGTYRDKSGLYMISPWIDNGSLWDFLNKNERRFDVDRTALLRETAEAITFLHDKRVIHGDIKASNILVTGDLHVRICDFGLSRIINTATVSGLKTAGTMRWQSPELWTGASKSFKSDVYAFGITISEVLSGKRPYPELDDAALIILVGQRGQRPKKQPASSQDGVSYAYLWSTAERCWQADPNDRPLMPEVCMLLAPPKTPALGEGTSSSRGYPVSDSGHRRVRSAQVTPARTTNPSSLLSRAKSHPEHPPIALDSDSDRDYTFLAPPPLFRSLNESAGALHAAEPGPSTQPSARPGPSRLANPNRNDQYASYEPSQLPPFAPPFTLEDEYAVAENAFGVSSPISPTGDYAELGRSFSRPGSSHGHSRRGELYMGPQSTASLGKRPRSRAGSVVGHILGHRPAPSVSTHLESSSAGGTDVGTSSKRSSLGFFAMFHRSKKERPRPVTLTPPYDPGPSRGRGEPSPVEVNTIRISESMKLEPYYGFTNVAPYEVIYKNKEYPTAEHLFQAMKFLPDQPRIAEHIRTVSSRPNVIREEALRNASHMRRDWQNHQIAAMDMVLDKKFEQHPELKRKLLETEQAYLILENGSKDTFWGNGDGDGLNRFGQALMRLREKLRSQR